MNRLLRRLLGLSGDSEAPIDYEQSKQLARHDDPEIRRQLAARGDLRPEILYFLAEDPAPEVRREIAANPATPAQAHLLLARDEDEEVRSGLAQKIARLAPGLSNDEQDRLRRLTHDALQILARDQLTRVRQLLAEALKDVAQAPPEVIRRLARDAELAVAGPVLEHSPVLTDDDLLEIIHSSPAKGALGAISRRAQVHARIADAIATSDDVTAITSLLANASAQIREETLDRLIDRAPDIELWHAPLVRRPQLSARAAARLARFVADNLLEVMQQRADLDPATAAAVAEVVHRRLNENPGLAEIERSSKTAPPVDEAFEMARRMHDLGKLDEPLLASALAANDREFLVAGLCLRAGLPLAVVHKVVATHSAKGMVAVAWKAGLSATFAVQLQAKLARIPPTELLHIRADDRYPLTVDEMGWQLSFFLGLAGDQVG